MPSPFPGMDPYIEDPKVWNDFHSNLASEIQGQLNEVIQPRYVARLNATVVYEVVEIGQSKAVRPDVGVWRLRPPPDSQEASVGVLTALPVESRVAQELPLRIHDVEVRKVDTMDLVTVIEILSPVNKRPGHDAHRDYHRKRREFLRSSVHWMEIDLLRGGERPPLEEPVPPAPYYLMLSRVDRRPNVSVWPIHLQDRLPVVPVPLLEGDADVTLDLGRAVAAVYERGGYGVVLDYRLAPPPPPLAENDARWLEETLRAKGDRGTSGGM